MGFGGLEPFTQIMLIFLAGCLIYSFASGGKGKGGKNSGGSA